ncbi:MAG: hypothetical protein O7A98_02710 [Acidobacteria bacterium]|nr:hypothetical protein [Acidobacteriota bacterium]
MKKIVISSAVLFVVSMLLGFVVHGMLLHGDYEASGLMRSAEDQEAKFAFMLLAHVMIAIGFTLIYRRGRENKPWLGQGVRFGLLWAFASLIPMYLIYHAVMPFEIGLIGKQIVFDTVAVVLLGVVVAALNKE